MSQIKIRHRHYPAIPHTAIEVYVDGKMQYWLQVEKDNLALYHGKDRIKAIRTQDSMTLIKIPQII